MKPEATWEFVFVIRDKPKDEIGGLKLPDAALTKPQTGEIISVGELVADKRIKEGRKAIFRKQVGDVIELNDLEITVLNGNGQILGVC